jgi:hypothetical protein
MVINYSQLAVEFERDVASGLSPTQRQERFHALLLARLPDLWCGAYSGMPRAGGEIVVVTDHGFRFLFDLGAERVVAAYGLSREAESRRDSSRMRGYLPKVRSKRGLAGLAASAPDPDTAARRRRLAGLSYRARFFETQGDSYDRGHFLSHAQGGGLDINLFPQLTRVNQSRSDHGRRYRAMESICVATPGLFCFSRPIYDDDSWVPFELEYGLWYSPAHLDSEIFPNKVVEDAA